MKLHKIIIENFRSIKSQTLYFDNNCQILVGKNEAGKSNVLKAVASVFGEYRVSEKDKRKKIDNEEIDSYFIRTIIKLTEADFNEILGRFNMEYDNTENIVLKNNKTMMDLIKTIFCEFLIQIDIAEKQRPYYTHWTYTGSDFELENEIHLNKNTFSIESDGQKQEIDDIITLLFDILKDLYEESKYVCHFWRNEKSFLLSDAINTDNFIASPEKYEALQNIFVTCGYSNIKRVFSDFLLQDGDYCNLLDKVSKEITLLFRSIWKDFKQTKIEISQIGTEIKIKIVNKTKYSFDDRSDGFKKFISILIALSTRVRSNQIGERDVILIDEPDQSLYPTSAEYLRDELIKIGNSAKVIYATHSYYMLDSNNIERHLIIEKSDDITEIKKQDVNSPFSNDELLRRLVGSSMFEIIKPKNIIFEGWLDKELFNKYCQYNLIKNFENIGQVYLGGISGVETLVQLLILANKKFIIVADSDAISKRKRKEFTENYEEYALCWISYGDIISDVVTMEDFISNEKILECINKENLEYVYNPKKTTIENIESGTSNDKEKKHKIKKLIVNELKKRDIIRDYSIFVEKLKIKIEEI